MEAGFGKSRKQMSPRVRRVGETMQTECEGTAAALQCRELETIGTHHLLLDVHGHGETVPE